LPVAVRRTRYTPRVADASRGDPDARVRHLIDWIEGVRRGERSYEGEFRLRHKDGHYVHALDTAEGTIDVPGCEGLTLDLDALWHELDEEIEAEAPPGED
jgi:PAS domain-containing protein